MIHELNGVQRDLLFLISGLDRPNGQEILAEIEESERPSVGQGQVYKNLDRLADKGLVSKGQRNGRTNEYELTAAGERILDSIVDWQVSYLTDEDITSVLGRL